MARTNKLSVVVAHKLAGIHTIPRRYRDKSGIMGKGDWKLRFEEGAFAGSFFENYPATFMHQPNGLLQGLPH
jgi:hypothetical protein